MTEEEALQLRKENQDLREALKQTQELLHIALARIEELEKQKTPPPAFIKANKQELQEDEKKAQSGSVQISTNTDHRTPRGELSRM